MGRVPEGRGNLGQGRRNNSRPTAVSSYLHVCYSITTHFINKKYRYFYNPRPLQRDILDCVSCFVDALNKSLKKGVNRACHLTVEFHTDISVFCKGSPYQHGKGRLYTFDDFDSAYFPQDWQTVHDRLGDGCTIGFPIRMYSWVKWSPTIYTCSENGGVSPKKKHFVEVCTLFLIKMRC